MNGFELAMWKGMSKRHEYKAMSEKLPNGQLTTGY
jgi:hypothetical protein